MHTVWGPSLNKSDGGAIYFITFIDDYCRKVWVEFIRHKDEVYTKFKEWKAKVETQTGRKVRYLRSNNGGEYTSKEFESFCKEESISRHLTTSYTF